MSLDFISRIQIKIEAKQDGHVISGVIGSERCDGAQFVCTNSTIGEAVLSEILYLSSRPQNNLAERKADGSPI